MAAYKTAIFVGCVALATVGTLAYLDNADKAAQQRDAERRAVINTVKQRLDRTDQLPRRDRSITQSTIGQDGNNFVPQQLPAKTTINYAVDVPGQHYLVCTPLEKGGAYYATLTGTFSGPAKSCRTDADPVGLNYALEAKMTQAGIDHYLETRPQLASKPFVQQACESVAEEGQIQGCYTKNRIFLIDLPQEEIHSELSVTAAHEMLHVAWDTLSGSAQNDLASQLEKIVAQNPKIKDRIELYKGDGRLNELHSIIGTEVANVGDELEKHYAQFLADRKAIAKRHLAYQKVLDDLQAEIKSLKARLDRLDEQADALLAAGNVGAYNALVQPYNSLVAEINAKVETYNDLTAHTRPDEQESGVRAR